MQCQLLKGDDIMSAWVPNPSATTAQITMQAQAMQTEGRALMRSSNPMLRAQGLAMMRQAAALYAVQPVSAFGGAAAALAS
jgi:hypothetical protein